MKVYTCSYSLTTPVPLSQEGATNFFTHEAAASGQMLFFARKFIPKFELLPFGMVDAWITSKKIVHTFSLTDGGDAWRGAIIAIWVSEGDIALSDCVQREFEEKLSANLSAEQVKKLSIHDEENE
jgi:hypothetical protein